jgi:hypothetical protein
MAFLKISGLALAVLLGLSLPIGQAKAMPANGLADTIKQIPKSVENVAWVCGPYRCWSTGWSWRRPYAYWGWRRPLYAYAGPYAGWRRPLYAYARPYMGWRRPLYGYAGPYMGWRRPLYAYAGWRRPLYAYAGPDVGRSMPMPAGVDRSMPMRAAYPIGAGVDRSTGPQSQPVSALIPGTPAALIPGTPAASILGMAALPTPMRVGIPGGADGA